MEGESDVSGRKDFLYGLVMGRRRAIAGRALAKKAQAKQAQARRAHAMRPY
jgi:hypothetical protein